MGGVLFEYTFIWFISAMLIIGICLYEEVIMNEKYPKQYADYRSKTSFLIPLPKIIKRLLMTPFRLVFKKKFPEKRREVFFIVFFYGILIIIISLIFNPFLVINYQTNS